MGKLKKVQTITSEIGCVLLAYLIIIPLAANAHEGQLIGTPRHHVTWFALHHTAASFKTENTDK